MAKKTGEDLSITDMDFGDFISPDEDFIQPPLPEGVKESSEEEEEELNKEEEDDTLNVNAALAEAGSEEEEEDDKGEAKKEIEDKNELPASTDDEPFTLVLARYQLEQGVLSSLDEEKLQGIIEKDGEEAALSYLIQNEVDLNTKAVSEKLDDYSKEYTELRKAGFSPEDAGNTVLTLEALDSISEEDLVSEDNEELRRTVLKENYKATTRFSEAKIDRLVKRAFDINVDTEDAKEALESLKEAKKQELDEAKAAQKKAQEKAQEEYNEGIQTLNKHIDSLESIIPDKKINKQTKEKIKDIITKPVKQSEDGYSMNAMWAKRNENPAEFDTVLAYLYMSGIFDGKWDQITKTVNTKLTNKLGQKLKSGTGTTLLGGKHVNNASTSEQTRQDMIGPMRGLLED